MMMSTNTHGADQRTKAILALPFQRSALAGLAIVLAIVLSRPGRGRAGRPRSATLAQPGPDHPGHHPRRPSRRLGGRGRPTPRTSTPWPPAAPASPAATPPRPITLPSHASILTGLFPPRHGVRDNGTFVLAPKVETLAERLAARGYDTAAVVSAVVLARRQGLDQGFRVYDDDLGDGYAAGTVVARADRPRRPPPPPCARWPACARPSSSGCTTTIRTRSTGRRPASPTPPAGPTASTTARSPIWTSRSARCSRSSRPAPTSLAVGDHGEMLGEHGEAHPRPAALPRRPAGAAHPRRPRRARRQGERLPGAHRRRGADAPRAGRAPRAGAASTAAACCRCRRDGAARATPTARASCRSSPTSGTRCARWATTASSISRRRRAASTISRPIPARRATWRRTQPGPARTWEEQLAGAPARRWGRSSTPRCSPRTCSPRSSAASSRASATSAARPRGRSPGPCPTRAPWSASPRTSTAPARPSRRGTATEALPALQAIVKQDPHNFPALSLAGFCLRQAGRTESALAAFQRAQKENDLNAVPIADAAGCLLDLGRKPEAEREYRRALALDPAQAVAATNLARMLRAKGDRKGAVEVLDTALRAGAHESDIYLERGVARAEAGNLEGALADFREAARRAPANPVPLENAARDRLRPQAGPRRLPDLRAAPAPRAQPRPTSGRPRAPSTSMSWRTARRPCAASAAPSCWRAMPASAPSWTPW